MNDKSNQFDPDFAEWSQLWNDPELADVDSASVAVSPAPRKTRGRLSFVAEFLAGALVIGAVAAPETLTATARVPHLGLSLAALVALALPWVPFWLGGVGSSSELALPTLNFAQGAPKRLRRQLIATLFAVLAGVGLLSVALSGGVARPVLAALAGIAVAALSITRGVMALSVARQHGEAADSLLDVEAGRMALPSRTGPKLALGVIVTVALAGAVASGLHARGPHGIGEHESVDVPILVTADDANAHALWERWNLVDYSVVGLEGRSFGVAPDAPLDERVEALRGLLTDADEAGHGLVFIELDVLGAEPQQVLGALELDSDHVEIPEHATMMVVTAGDFAVYQPRWLEPSRWAHRVSFGGPAPALRYLDGAARKTAFLEALGNLEGFRLGDSWAQGSMDAFRAHHAYNLGLELPAQRRASLSGFPTGVGVTAVTEGGIYVTHNGNTLWVEEPESFRVVMWSHPFADESAVGPNAGIECEGLTTERVQRFVTLENRRIEITPYREGVADGGAPTTYEVEVEPDGCQLVEVDPGE